MENDLKRVWPLSSIDFNVSFDNDIQWMVRFWPVDEKQWLEMANLWWGAEIEELGPISEDEERKSRQSEVAKVAVDQEWIKARELARKSGK